MDELLCATRGVVEAPVEQVAELVFEGYEGAEAGGYVKQTVDRERRRVLQEGHWWYRGVTSVSPHEKGALVTFELFNIARAGRWMVRGVLLQYRLNGTLQEVRTGNLGERLAELGARLGCRAYLIGS